MSHLRLVFHHLSQYGIVVNAQKSVLGVLSLTFLGHVMDTNGIRPLSDKVDVIQSFHRPTTRQKLREYLGLVTSIGGSYRIAPSFYYLSPTSSSEMSHPDHSHMISHS